MQCSPASLTSGNLLKPIGFIVVGFSLLLLLTNLFGLSQTLAPDNLTAEHLRFKQNDVIIDKTTFRDRLVKQPSEDNHQFAVRVTDVIASGLAHLHWQKYSPERFNQRVPFWENFILYAMGRWSGIPEFERYHFVDINKSIERGIGICGDASMMLSQVLNNNGISNKIITVPGHVMVESRTEQGLILLDPDFGVVFPHDVNFYQQNPKELETEYHQKGFIKNGEDVVVRGITKKIQYWDGVQHFITKKYYFEKISYWLIWILPLFGGVIGILLIKLGSAKRENA